MICLISAEREREFEQDRDRERDSIFRIRERTRWLDTALREDRLDHDRSDTVLGFDTKKQSGSQNALSFGEELQYWIDKVLFSAQQFLFYFLVSLQCFDTSGVHAKSIYVTKMAKTDF